MLAALVSCSNENELSQQSAEDTAIRIQANVGGITTSAGSSIQGNQFDNTERVNVYIYMNILLVVKLLILMVMVVMD